MTELLFYVFAAVALGGGLGVVLSKNPVASLLFMVFTLGSVAGIFVLFEAHFLAAIQVLVYAGAIMVLFLFVIMLLNLTEEDLAKLATGPRLHAVGAFFAVGFLAALVWTCKRAGLFDEPIGGGPAGETYSVAVPLFQEYVLPFEIVSFLLLAAIVGAVLITKRRLQ